MKVYTDDDGGRRLIGHADVPDDCGPVYEVPVVKEALAATEEFAVGAVTHPPEGGGAPVAERAVPAAPGQLVELLPGWAPLAS
ncbi:hypothetical protein GCM10009416_07090 [Craurococcus roseus]|uniref:Uncharacterized protein n=1 Tax=Craurococcus roseus TaxID=77585 RepID=A0ABN1EPN7_9PROT